MKRIIFLFIALGVLCIGCGKNEDDKDKKNEEINLTPAATNTPTPTAIPDFTLEDIERIKETSPEGYNSVKESLSGVSLTNDDDKYVVKLNDTAKGVYYHDGEKITGYEILVEFDSAANAELAKAKYLTSEKDDSIESVSVDENKLVIKCSPSAYKDLTLNEVKSSYELLQKLN